MYTFTFIAAAAVALCFGAAPACAQNLIENGTFDGSTAGWTLSDAVEWSSFGRDYGSIHLASEKASSAATQCVSAEGGMTFVITAQVTGQCPGARLLGQWAAMPDCSDFRAFPINFVNSTLTNKWEPLSVVVPARDDAHMIFVELLNVGGCSGGYFFDDVALSFDNIYDDDFEGMFGVQTLRDDASPSL